MKKIVRLFICLMFVLCIYNAGVGNVQAQQNYTITSVKASHILVDTKEQAELIKTKINSGDSFEQMAKKFSKCPSRQDGGDLGYFERGQMVKSFEAAAFSLPTGQVSDPVKTQFGWHLIKVYDKK